MKEINPLLFLDVTNGFLGHLWIDGFKKPKQYKFVGDRQNLIWKPLNSYWNDSATLSPDFDDAALVKKLFLKYS